MRFIQLAGDRLTAILNGPGDPAEKKQQLQALIDETMDVRGIARFALGRFWSLASAGQRDEYVRAFPAVLLGNVVRTFGDYQGLRYTIDRAIQLDDSVQVSTTVFRPRYPLQQVVWVTGAVEGATKILDIIAAGASLRIAQRDDCARYLAHNSIDSLIETLRRQVAVTS